MVGRERARLAVDQLIDEPADRTGIIALVLQRRHRVAAVELAGQLAARNAGLAVPDWPTTFGYNMFLYPPSSWFAAPWNTACLYTRRAA